MKAISFEFVSYKVFPKKGEIVFKYKMAFSDAKSIEFTEKLLLSRKTDFKRVPKNALANILRDVHLAIGVSYYKTYCPKVIKVPYSLSKDQAGFWNTLYTKGLGEFFYKNKIDFRRLIKFPCSSQAKNTAVAFKRKDRSLVGVGGGKDSILAIEMLKQDKFKIDAFVIESEKSYQEVDNVIKLANLRALRIKRIIDKKLLKGDLIDSLNGHIPVSSIYAFLGVLSAILYDYSYVVVGNEYSSNFGNIKYLGNEINHQWSKSQEFESMFRAYSLRFITGDITYFSLLRPFYEIKIVKMFLEKKKYLSAFSSCNSRFKVYRERTEKKWCGVCPKCVFMFTMFSAFMPKRSLIKMFDKNLYEDKGLEPLFLDVLGLGKMKPFECVGTFDEARCAMLFSEDNFKDSYILKKILSRVKIFKDSYDYLFVNNKAQNIPPRFRFVGVKKVILSGYGKEGKATHKYLKKHFKGRKVIVAESVDSQEYKDIESKCDLAIKSPGVPSRKIGIQYTTATNIFLSHIYGKNIIVGVTGSKGKSTTASLIFELLNSAGRSAVLLGNIGTPMLEFVDKIKEEILVIEFSSYQLEDIYYSPNLAVLTNLFPEHMNYHGGLGPYYSSKENIVKYQNENDLFFYGNSRAQVSPWIRKGSSTLINFSSSNVDNPQRKLIGSHNLSNIKAAVSVAKYFAVSNKVVKSVVSSFKPLAHRLELVGTFNSIHFYDDAISTTPESTVMALKSLRKVDTVFLGGEDRGYDFRNLEKVLLKKRVRNLVLFPDSGRSIIRQRKSFNILETRSMKRAVEFAYDNTKKNHVCLLSTASPSYSLWASFEEKGSEFRKSIRLMSNGT